MSGREFDDLLDLAADMGATLVWTTPTKDVDSWLVTWQDDDLKLEGFGFTRRGATRELFAKLERKYPGLCVPPEFAA